MVVRYFGGTKLGKPGLIKAYGHTAALCLQKAALIALTQTQNFTITYPYSQQPSINQLKNSFDLKELNAEYLEEVTLKMACRLEQAPAFAEKLQQLAHLGIEIEKGEQSYVTLNID